jgi:hypothetical protein
MSGRSSALHRNPVGGPSMAAPDPRWPVEPARRTSGETGTAHGPSMYGSRVVAVPLAVVLLVTVDAAMYTYCGAPWGASALVASVISFTAWLSTTFRRPASAPAAFVLYIGTATALMLFEAEQWYRQMPSQLMRLYPHAFPLGVGLSDHAFISVFPLAASALFVLGALTYYHRSAFGRFAAWFAFSWALTASLSVFVYAMVAKAPFGYLGGMITAPIPFVLALAGMFRLVRREGLETTLPEAGRDRLRDGTMGAGLVDARTPPR